MCGGRELTVTLNHVLRFVNHAKLIRRHHSLFQYTHGHGRVIHGKECTSITWVPSCMGKMFLLIVDTYTKWLDVHITSVSLPQLSCWGSRLLPEVLVSDNGTNFTSEEFSTFMCANGIKHVKTPPYHPSSNGLVECAVHTLKTGIFPYHPRW